MSVSREDIRRMAQLARVALPEAQIPRLGAELGDILAHMDVLMEVAGRAPDDVPAGMPLASDEPPSVGLVRARETFAPAMRDGFFLVPRLATHGDETGAA